MAPFRPGPGVAVTDERTEFKPVGAYDAWWYEGLGQERDEYLYKQTDARRITLAETPLTLKRTPTTGGLHLSFHEAALVDFPSMLLAGDGAGVLKAKLMPWQDGTLAKKTGPFTTPWRTVLIGDSAGALADSRIELNLNEPSKIADTSWIKPGKYVGIWWEMHLERSTWGSGPKHGANTANTKRYMDFAAKYGFDGVLVEGWNEGWDGDWISQRREVQLHQGLSGLRPQGDHRLRQGQGRQADRPQRDGRRGAQLRGPAGRRHEAL
jgi:alpha-glucosidase